MVYTSCSREVKPENLCDEGILEGKMEETNFVTTHCSCRQTHHTLVLIEIQISWILAMSAKDWIAIKTDFRWFSWYKTTKVILTEY